jgi:hypothetical protein
MNLEEKPNNQREAKVTYCDEHFMFRWANCHASLSSLNLQAMRKPCTSPEVNQLPSDLIFSEREDSGFSV